jgi:hypothetical protein
MMDSLLQGTIFPSPSTTGLVYSLINQFLLKHIFCSLCGIFSDVYPGSEFLHPGSRVKKIPDPHQRIEVFLTQKTVSRLSEK